MIRIASLVRSAALGAVCLGLAAPSVVLAHADETASAASQSQALNVVIMMGQSNMDGRGDVAQLPELPAGVSDVLINYRNPAFQREGRERPDVGCQSDGWVRLQPGFSLPPRMDPTPDCLSSTFGPEIGLAVELKRRLPDAPFAFVKFSEGGTSLRRDWDPDTRGALFDLAVEHIEASLAGLAEQDRPLRIFGIVWHQGEGDLNFTKRGGDYSGLLKTFADKLRTKLRMPDVPFVIGEVYNNNGGRDSLRKEQAEAAKEIDHAVFVSSADLTPMDGDNSAGGTHFDTASTITLGRRLGSALADTVETGS